MSEDTSLNERRFDTAAPASVPELGTGPMEPPSLVRGSARPHSPTSKKSSPMEPLFGRSSPVSVHEVGKAPVEPPPVPPSSTFVEVPSAGFSVVMDDVDPTIVELPSLIAVSPSYSDSALFIP